MAMLLFVNKYLQSNGAASDLSDSDVQAGPVSSGCPGGQLAANWHLQI